MARPSPTRGVACSCSEPVIRRYYIPQQDVRMELLTRSASSTVCPYKGTASYWSLRVDDRMVEDVAWAYLDPLPDCPRIAGYLCFYPEKVDRIEVEGEPR
jgi:uncharacterized protein (DUF427 family)